VRLLKAAFGGSATDAQADMKAHGLAHQVCMRACVPGLAVYI
jgi:hypothetical protein